MTMKRILVAVMLALLPKPAGADENRVNRLEVFAEKFRATTTQAKGIHKKLFMEEAPKGHVDAVFSVSSRH